ncbi:helix-turn-helix domain-containing protein [Methylocystis iwaonis]|uniref:Insertion element IS150 protein InsJ-like helix-turn-helix domain-containing protein n=1 Tax=Methylocystis iwaonis TaxID=2885079 RepID=A0ABM8E6X9_9HYPH|nr:helix-turn-helix domain-containing protein [Methylocystis iwaonis]BDV33446.1 hypothetical protein SS37A_09750 [Methylocystis iwaonis]BDV33612.1 hypothetical protein SS37A_11410 [Methylocystis iwaonis]BDV33631.1 hypothetical protein SS37A_11600 [Methylocystis iwaonis]BDV33996.1 hypothetical protein SS37A_15250 [Methylocystis iwaonis]
MPIRERAAVEERIALFRDFDTGVFTVSELCRLYGVSRETFYVWKRRRESGEARWFEERSRAPLRAPQAATAETIARILDLRRRFPHFGPKKIRARLLLGAPETAWPAASTIGDILKREGLIAAKPRCRRPVGRGEIIAGSDAPNGEWAMDFKGWFRTRDGRRIDPLTVSDTASRYLVDVRITPPTHDGVKGALLRIFSDIGLPAAPTMARPSARRAPVDFRGFRSGF